MSSILKALEKAEEASSGSRVSGDSGLIRTRSSRSALVLPAAVVGGALVAGLAVFAVMGGFSRQGAHPAGQTAAVKLPESAPAKAAPAPVLAPTPIAPAKVVPETPVQAPVPAAAVKAAPAAPVVAKKAAPAPPVPRAAVTLAPVAAPKALAAPRLVAPAAKPAVAAVPVAKAPAAAPAPLAKTAPAAARPVPVAAKAAAIPAPVMKPQPVPAAAVAPAVAPRPVAAVPQPAPAPVQHAAPAPAVRPPAPASAELPSVSGIAWQNNGESSFAVVNGRAVVQGGTVDGYRVLEIRPDRVKFQGEAGPSKCGWPTTSSPNGRRWAPAGWIKGKAEGFGVALDVEPLSFKEL